MSKQAGGTTVYAPGMRKNFLGIPQYGAGIAGGWFPFKGLIEAGIEANKKGQLGGKKQRDLTKRQRGDGLKKRQRGDGLKKRQRGGVLKKRQRGGVLKKRQRGGFMGLATIASLVAGLV